MLLTSTVLVISRLFITIRSCIYSRGYSILSRRCQTQSQTYNSSSANPIHYQNSLCRSNHGLRSKVSRSHPASELATEVLLELDVILLLILYLDSRAAADMGAATADSLPSSTVTQGTLLWKLESYYSHLGPTYPMQSAWVRSVWYNARGGG